MKLKQRTLQKIILAILVLCGGVQGYQANTPVGKEIKGMVTQIVDGDTMRINGVKLRLWGVDAPEKEQIGWQEAKDFLSSEVFLSAVTCTVHTYDKYGRMVAQCARQSDDTDIGAAIIRAGRARDYSRYSKGFYLPQQIKARKEHLGLWEKK